MGDIFFSTGTFAFIIFSNKYCNLVGKLFLNLIYVRLSVYQLYDIGTRIKLHSKAKHKV